ncbi:MAG TPA: hypothetical protein VIJ39_00870 [Solirubrobacteraceae bacterium]
MRFGDRECIDHRDSPLIAAFAAVAGAPASRVVAALQAGVLDQPRGREGRGGWVVWAVQRSSAVFVPQTAR